MEPDSSVPSSVSIQEELERIVSSRTFHFARGQKKFLQYAVEQTIAGRSLSVKEYSVGVEVFGRGTDFDPRVDNIVRVEARKLRARLTKYYESEGERNPIRIELPSRGYIPMFREIRPFRDNSTGLTCTMEMQTAASGLSEDLSRSESSNSETEALPRLASLSNAGPVVGEVFTGLWPKMAAGFMLLILMNFGLYFAHRVWPSANRYPEGPSIAILPFQELGEDHDQSFGDGLTDELIDALGKVQGLRVVARTSAFQFRGEHLDIREIGKTQHVRAVLEGSARIYGNRLRITAELEDATNGYRIWSSSYDRDFEDVIAVQREISTEIVAALRTEFGKDVARDPLEVPTSKTMPVNPEAYKDYLRGINAWHKQTADSIRTSMDYFKRAITEDPNYPPAYTGLARCYINLPLYTTTQARDVIPSIRALAQKALNLDSTLLEPRLDLAIADYMSYDWLQADAEFKKVLDLSPGDPVAHRRYSIYLKNAGRTQEALVEINAAQQLDPFSPYMLKDMGEVLYAMRRYDAAADEFKRALQVDPDYGSAQSGLGSTYLQKGMYKEAIAQFELSLLRAGMRNDPSVEAELAYTYAVSGNTSAARKILQDFLDQSARGSFPPKAIAEIYIGLGERDRAFEWLGRAVEARDASLGLVTNPLYDRIRSDPRFTELVRRAQLTSPEYAPQRN